LSTSVKPRGFTHFRFFGSLPRSTAATNQENENYCECLKHKKRDVPDNAERFLTAKAACVAELSGAKTRAAELNTRLDCSAEKAEFSRDEPLLQCVLDADNITDEVLSLVDCVMVYAPERVEIRLAFNDTN